MCGVVLHDPRRGRPELGVVLDHHDARLDRQRLPDPVVVAVDVDAEEVELLEARGFDKRGDVLARHEAVRDLQLAGTASSCANPRRIA